MYLPYYFKSELSEKALRLGKKDIHSNPFAMKNLKLLSLGFALILFVLIFCVACEKETNQPSSEFPTKEAVITFEIPVGIDQLKVMEARYNIKVTQLESITKIGSIEFSEGMNLFGKISLDQVNDELIRNFNEQIQILISTYSTDQNISDSDRAEVLEYYNGLKNTSRAPSLILRTTIIGSEQNIRLLAEELKVGTLDLVEDILKSYENEKVEIDPRSLPAWKPNVGTMEVGSVSSTKRFVSHTMKWTYTNPFNGYPNATYEHDFFLNNYSGSNYPGTYLSLAEDSQERPLADYWNCTLPSYYLDTRFGDSNNEIAYTIGCANANAIVKNVLYSNYMKISKGSANIDNSKLFFQKGKRIPASCYTTWCSYGNANYVQFPAWDFVVPAGISWTN